MASSFLPAGATTGDSGGELSSGDDSGEVEFPHSPEIEESSCLAELFEKAAAHLQGLIQVASREQLLYLYARYKQVKVGNCNTPKPSFFDFEGKQKWEAWKALGDSSPSQAMQEYIAVVKKLDPGWNPQRYVRKMNRRYQRKKEKKQILVLVGQLLVLYIMKKPSGKKTKIYLITAGKTTLTI